MLKFILLALAVVIVSAKIQHHKGRHLNKFKKHQHRQNGANLQVETENGVVQGREATTISQQVPYYAFHGIPYAIPPTEDRRFLPPEKAKNWTGVYNATYERNICIQPQDTIGPTVGNEDCLYINVYTVQLPSSSNSNLLPVMVWIYGGGFLNGDGNYTSYGPDYLLEEHVLVVTFNYRLGILGFLSTGDEVVTGNNALRDQILALHWVQNNIAAFGGDPKNVTIFGESAGAASVSYLLQTNLTSGLYQKAIMQSGTTLCLWALSRKARSYAFDVGKKLGINTSNSKILVERLRNKSIDQLQSASVTVMLAYIAVEPLNSGLILAPVSEPDSKGAVFSSRSYVLLENGEYNQVPILLGFNSQESYGFASLIRLLRPYYLTYDLIPSRLVPADMNITDESIAQDVGTAIKTHYVGSKGSFTFSNKTYDYLSDDEFVRPIRQYVRLTASKVNTFYYRFSYVGILGNPSRENNNTGVGHGEDLHYLFRDSSGDSANSADARTRSRMVRLWTNFAKTGSPTPTEDPLLQNVIWKPSNQDNFEYLDIGVNLTLNTNPDAFNMAFWDYIYSQYGNPPYDTY